MLRDGWERFADGHRLAEFLPDAEGVVERRHSPVAGLLIVVVALAFGVALAWSALTEVERRWCAPRARSSRLIGSR